MFKNLLQLLLETFIKSKKKWISEQSNLSNQATNYTISEFIPQSNGESTFDQTYSAPNDGWFICGYWFVSAVSLSNLSKNEIGNGKTWGSPNINEDIRVFVPCCKGDNVKLRIRTCEPENATGYLRFIPKAGII